MVSVWFSAAAQRQVERLPKVVRARLVRVVHELERWPQVSGVKALRGNRTGAYRKRTGDYRIIFRVEDARLVIESVGHRREVYED